MDSENRKGKALSFSVDGRDVENQNKRNYNSLLEYKKTSDGANRDFKAATSKLPRGRNRWHIIGSESSAGFLAGEKSGEEKSHPS